MRYYHCINCGHDEDLGRERKRGLKCSECDYDDLTHYTKEEWLEMKAEKKRIRAWMNDELDIWEYSDDS